LSISLVRWRGSTVAVVKIESAASVEALRKLRNQTSAGFSSFNGHISADDQKRWWEEMRHRIRGWTYWTYAESVPLAPIGFGLVREEDGRWWNSIGVSPDFQGRGFGSLITHDVLVRFGGVVFAAVRLDNAPALLMHHKFDWEEIDGPEPERLRYFRSNTGAA